MAVSDRPLGRRAAASLARELRRLDGPLRTVTSGVRMLPSVLLIGSQKAGTTSLYSYLLQHPRMFAPARKEIGFFDIHFARGLGWYRSRFPLKRPWPAFTMEASTGYFDYVHAPRHVRSTLPHSRLIVLLRDPVERAHSHYLHTTRIGYESLAFEEAIGCEQARIGPQLARMEADPGYYAREINYYSYLRRGRYAEHLERWLEYFPRDRLLVLKTEDLAASPGPVLDQVWAFIGLPAHRPAHFERHNSAPRGEQELASETRAALEEYFAPHNQRLERLLGRRFGWGGGASVGARSFKD